MQLVKERAFWLAWSKIPGIGSVLIQRLHQHFGSLSDAWEAGAAELGAVAGFGYQTIDTVVQARRSLNPEQLLQQHEQENPCFWTPADPDYPHLLREIADPPPILYYRGQVEPLENQGITPAIAIVGTRDPSDYGRRWARKLSAALAQAGFTVVSGLAEGVDTEVHQSCLAAGGRTIAVMGTGIDIIYPWFNRKLAQQILPQGLLMSEYPAQTQPDRTNFPRRNRIIAGLCRATLVIEAPRKSGALITARLANEYGRDVYVLPGTLDNPRARGCLEFLNQGAQVILGERELLDELKGLPQLYLPAAPVHSIAQLSLLPEATPTPHPALSTDLQQVLHNITLEPLSLDHIVQQANLDTGTVLSALSQLELMGLVLQLPGMRYQRG
ncbi:MAG TPA: DNA-processing protein DprA [Allocoleopsis sp.]